MITLTPRAAQKIRELSGKLGKASPVLRVRVVPGGCSGLSYEFQFVDRTEADDVVAELDGAKAAVDSKSHLFLAGSVLDYAESLMKSGFEMSNPKATASCSCGTSFTTAEAPAEEESFSV